MAGGEPALSRRLRALTDMVPVGSRVVDVGCDHGFMDIYLVCRGISPHVLAMDVRTGPLSGAREHIAEYGLEDYIETRLSDGLEGYEPGEADCLVCAGMGGRLMMRILAQGREKTRGMKELILQPQSELPEFRRFLRDQGYRVTDENILCEEDKYYFLFRVCPDGEAAADAVTIPKEDGKLQELYDKYGRLLLQRRHPVLREYLTLCEKTTRQIRDCLIGQESRRAAERLSQVEQELADLHGALALYDPPAQARGLVAGDRKVDGTK